MYDNIGLSVLHFSKHRIKYIIPRVRKLETIVCRYVHVMEAPCGLQLYLQEVRVHKDLSIRKYEMHVGCQNASAHNQTSVSRTSESSLGCSL